MENSSPMFPHSDTPLSRGFTLIEVMLVVVIILIAAGMAVPMLSGSSDAAQMRDAVRSTIRLSRYARSMAILNQADCTLSFSTNRITLAGTEGTLAERRISDKITIADFENLAKEDRRDTDEDEEGKKVIFYPTGMNDGFEVTLEDEDGRSHTIKCNPITGKVTTDED
ncbi:type II secretion system protein [Tichowtungia aerotolerans]|uniref:Type II secretion system protein H n=1 Tax=Tichowtungia aerotolerans TaxID=2697043 RepID=A0A6P1MD00_9BACT|nr:type II secretion system protein [Tichowtungia aerotolerans]QHI70454.1 prepilin-type N-terminal cleavage/methylation domain-containing protein [Tichowtungia aerotolerans]